MASRRRSSWIDRSSIRYWWIPQDVDSFESDIALTNGDIQLKSSSRAKSSKQLESKSFGNGVSTSQFVSTIASIWDCVGQPAVLQTKSGSKYGEICPNKDIICYSDTLSVGGENLSNDQSSRSCYPSSARSSFEDLKTFKKMCFASCNRNISNLIISSTSHSNVDSLGLNKVDDIEVATCSTQNNSTTEGEDFSGSQNVNLVGNVQQHTDSLCMTDSLQSQPGTSIKDQVLISADWALGQSQSTGSRCIDAESSTEVSASKDHIIHKTCNSILREVVDVEEYSMRYWLSMQDKLQLAFAKNKHALAGALAGTLVSLCLHPVDTVKTVIQANCAGKKSSYDILRTIISERGALGLYRGIASNITSSAPISAIYTYTYESVKCALLPILPKEYHSLAHCIAGGCSSIATSFVFTPSERIKQQMQVGSHYQNCWKALIGCLEKGGVPSLFSGWSAVLCRNIPHSIIKFYTYESLKQFFSKSSKPDAGLSTLQTTRVAFCWKYKGFYMGSKNRCCSTDSELSYPAKEFADPKHGMWGNILFELVCGGLAGSTAALFTTPFDVVKTRLQTQVPGSLAKYDGVLHALQEIAREEELQGLYRGLTPRLAMYVSQGAIFFASYEFLKAGFSLETQRAPSRIVKNEEAADPVPSRLQTLNS